MSRRCPRRRVEAAGITLERIAVKDCGNAGLRAISGAEFLLSDSLIVNNSAVGLSAIGARASLERVVIKDTRPQSSDQRFGEGIDVVGGASPATLRMKDCVVQGNRNAGIIHLGADGILEGVVVRNTQPQAKDSKFGIGVVAYEQGVQSTLLMRDCLVTNNHYAGIDIVGSSATVERTVARDTLPSAISASRSGVPRGASSGPW